MEAIYIQFMANCVTAPSITRVLEFLSNVTLTRCSPVTWYGDIGEVNIGSGNLLVAWQHQAITWTNAGFLLVEFCGIRLRKISQRVP